MSQPVNPATPPQTTDDDDSESSDPSHTLTGVTAPGDNVTSYLTSCQLTPPTPPTFQSSATTAAEVNQVPPSSPQLHDKTRTETTALNVCRKRGRQKQPVVATGSNAYKNSTSECDKIKSFVTNFSVVSEETGVDRSPVRKTRRKSLRIREISRQQRPETFSSEGKKETARDDMSTSRRIICQTSNDLLTSGCRTSATDSSVAASVGNASNHDQPAFHLSPRESSASLALHKNNNGSVEGHTSCGGEMVEPRDDTGFLLPPSNFTASTSCSDGQWRKKFEETAEIPNLENLEKTKFSPASEIHPIKIWKKLAEATVENVLNRDCVKQTWDSSGKNPRSEYAFHSNSRHAPLQCNNVSHASSHLLGHSNNNAMKEHLQQTTSDQLRRYTDLQRQMQLQCRKQHLMASSRSGIPPSLMPMLSSHLQNSQQKVLNVPQTSANHHLHQLHQLQMQQDDETHVCVECRKVFKRSIYLQRHMAREHWTTAKLFRCDTCSYETKHQSNLLVHKRTHTGERPYYCGACGQRYTQGHLLKAHIRSRHFSNMQLYNMEKRSPSEVLAAQAAAGDSNEKRRSPGDASSSRKINIPSAAAKSGEGFETATVSKANVEETGRPSDTMKLLIEAAYNGQNSFRLHNRTAQRSLLKSSACYKDNSLAGVKVERQPETSPLEENDIVDHSKAFNFAKPFFQQKLMKAEPLSLVDGELSCVTPVRVGNRNVESNGEVIDLDTPEPPATSGEVSADRDKMISSDAIRDATAAAEALNRDSSSTYASTSAVLSAMSKQAVEKYSNISGHSLFPYFSLLNNFQNSDHRYSGFPPINGSYLSTPPPLSSINNSIIYKAFSEKNRLDAFPGIGSVNSSRNCQVPNWSSRRSPVNYQAPVNISSGSENDCEDQFVDVDGDDDNDGNCATPLNLTINNRPETPLTENMDRLTPAEEYPRDLTKLRIFHCETKIEKEMIETEDIDDSHHSAFKTFDKLEEEEDQSQLLNDNNNHDQQINHVSLNHSGDEGHNDTSQKSPPVRQPTFSVNGHLHSRQNSDSMPNCGARSCIDVSSSASVVNVSGLLTTQVFDPLIHTQSSVNRSTTGETAAPREIPEAMENHGSFQNRNGDAVSGLCPNPGCPDRLKLEKLRRNVYKMLRVFMPYLGLDDVEDCRTDALDQFLHEVLYSKLDG